MHDYQQTKNRLASGWNTWNARSITSHVYLKRGSKSLSDNQEHGVGAFAINFCLLDTSTGDYLKEVVPGREEIRPGSHAIDGDYTDLTIRWRGVDIRIETAHDRDDIVAFISASKQIEQSVFIILEAGVLWNNPGSPQRVGESLVFNDGDSVAPVYATAEAVPIVNIPAQAAFLALPLEHDLGVSSGRRRSVAEIQAIIITKRAEQHKKRSAFGKSSAVADAVQNAIAWNTIYDPENDRVMTVPSRASAITAGGWIMRSSDSIAAAIMSMTENKDLAYSNLIELVETLRIEERTQPGETPSAHKIGYIPAETRAYGSHDSIASLPLASLAASLLFRRFGDQWLLELLFDKLLAFNRWWPKKRENSGFIAYSQAESTAANSPLYQDNTLSATNGLLNVADAGLTSLYILDCDCLAEIARVLGRAEAGGLRARADLFRGNAARLWNEETEFFYNRRLNTDRLDLRVSSAGFFALCARIPSKNEANRILQRYLQNPSEFGGEFAVPSLSRSDADFDSNKPMFGAASALDQLLILLGLSNYEQLGEAAILFSRRCESTLLDPWRLDRQIFAYSNPDTAAGVGSPLDTAGAVLGAGSLMLENDS
jgi:hypothetical protein